jgi:small subunit ribosomal protein S9
MPDTITHTIGRRKEAVCRVYIKAGSGKWDINGRTLGDYFPRPALVTAIQQPFTATDMLGRYDVKANINGGGQTGQSGALRLAVARALVKIDETHRRKLRDLGLLTRDARAVERKKPGRPKARKRFQFSKR